MSTVTAANAGNAAEGYVSPLSSEERLANKEVFLQLLVAQLKNQNPLSPADGIEFISQLAQFTQLEQSMSMRSDLAAIRAALEKPGTIDNSAEVPKGD